MRTPCVYTPQPQSAAVTTTAVPCVYRAMRRRRNVWVRSRHRLSGPTTRRRGDWTSGCSRPRDVPFVTVPGGPRRGGRLSLESKTVDGRTRTTAVLCASYDEYRRPWSSPCSERVCGVVRISNRSQRVVQSRVAKIEYATCAILCHLICKRVPPLKNRKRLESFVGRNFELWWKINFKLVNDSAQGVLPLMIWKPFSLHKQYDCRTNWQI